MTRKIGTKDYQSFVDYNIVDVELVDRLEDKLGMLQILFTMARCCKRNW